MGIWLRGIEVAGANALRHASPVVLFAAVAVLGAAACGGTPEPVRDDGHEPNSKHGTVRGRLAAPAADALEQGLYGASSSAMASSDSCALGQALSLDQVSVDLLLANPGAPAHTWAVAQSAVPDASGAFTFAQLVEGNYALRVNQPEFAAVAYGVDSTEFHLAAGQTVSVVLPLITTLTHGLTDPLLRSRQGGPPPVTAALDHATGEIALLSSLGFALVDPMHETMDLVFSRNFFPGPGLLSLAPATRIAWILYPDRLVRIDRSIFTDPGAGEVLNLDDPATRLAVGDKIRFAMLRPPQGHSGCNFAGERYFSPDEGVLYASTQESGVMVIDLAQMSIVRVIMGRVIGFNPVSNHLFFSNGPAAAGTGGTEVLVVDATTRTEVNIVALPNVLGVAPRPGSGETVMVGQELSTSEARIPFVRVVDATGTVIVNERAKDYLGIAHDPPAGAPSFDLTGEYFMIGSTAFQVLPGGGFSPVPSGVRPGEAFNQRVRCNDLRAVDPAHLYEIWYGCLEADSAVGLLSLDQTNVPVAVRPSVSTTEVLLDQTHGRAVFWDAEKVVFVHYADPTAAGRPGLVDLTGVVSPLVQPGAVCSATNPCSGTEVCAGETDTSAAGRCLPNPRLPYLPFCGGFGQAACDDGFTCSKVNPTNPNSLGQCGGYPSRDYAAHGPVCDETLPCPAGMNCGAGGRCEAKACIRDQDCVAWPGEVCGLVENLGRVCLTPGQLADGALCANSSECLNGACVAVKGAYAMAAGLEDLRFGPLGLRICTTPCYQNADCAGTQCAYEGPGPESTSGGAAAVWETHRAELAPYCRPPGLPPLEDCEGECTAGELCAIGGWPANCQTGFEPVAMVKNGEWVEPFCLPPAERSMWCEFPCRRSDDCPFTAECYQGSCSRAERPSSPCAMTCEGDRSCAMIDPGAFTFCADADSCETDADCGGGEGSCLHKACIGPPRSCANGSDCGPTEECAEVTRYPSAFECLPAQCGCTGPLAGDVVCRLATKECVLPLADGVVGCTDVPCDGSVLAECNVTPPDPLPPDCRCPGCAWNDGMCPGPSPASPCPAGFACTGLGAPPFPAHLGNVCVCDSPACQVP